MHCQRIGWIWKDYLCPISSLPNKFVDKFLWSNLILSLSRPTKINNAVLPKLSYFRSEGGFDVGGGLGELSIIYSIFGRVALSTRWLNLEESSLRKKLLDNLYSQITSFQTQLAKAKQPFRNYPIAKWGTYIGCRTCVAPGGRVQYCSETRWLSPPLLLLREQNTRHRVYSAGSPWRLCPTYARTRSGVITPIDKTGRPRPAPQLRPLLCWQTLQRYIVLLDKMRDNYLLSPGWSFERKYRR